MLPVYLDCPFWMPLRYYSTLIWIFGHELTYFLCSSTNKNRKCCAQKRESSLCFYENWHITLEIEQFHISANINFCKWPPLEGEWRSWIFKIVFTFDVFLVLKPQCTSKWHVFYIRNRHISVGSFVYKYDQWPHDSYMTGRAGVFKSKLYHFLQMSAFVLFMFHK